MRRGPRRPRRAVRTDGRLGLPDADQQLLAVMAQGPVGVAILDQDGRFLVANPALCTFLGRSEAELQSLSTLDVTHPDDVDADRAFGERIRQAGTSTQTLDKRFVRPDGGVVWGRVSATMIRGRDGRPDRMVGQVIDITESRHARVDREQNAWLQRVAGELGRIGGWAIDLPSGETRWSEAVLDIVGWQRDAPPTLDHVLTLLEPRAREATQRAFDHCVTSRAPVDLELSGRNFAGRRLTVRIVGEPQLEDDRVVRIVGAMQDVTAAKDAATAAERTAEELRNAIEHMTDGVCALDRNWRVVYANANGARMLDTTVEHMIGKNIWSLFPESFESDAHTAYADVLARNTTVHIDAYYNPRLHRWFEIDAVPTTHGLTTYFRDVTDRLVRERREARILQAERDATTRLRQLDQMKNTFLTAVSHELRTPLAVVEGAATTLQRLHHDLTVDRRDELIDALVDHSGRLRGLLEDLLDLERLTSTEGAIRPEPFDLVDVVTRTVASARARDRIRLTGDGSAPISADRVQVERIVANLLSNADKYAPTGPITVEIAGDERRVRLGVHDTGPGIPADQLEAVFDAFHRLDAAHPTPGTGVGLALVAQFARSHGGRAWAEARPDGGGHVFVELPTVIATPP